MELKAGSRWRSTTDSTEVVVVKAPGQPVELCCGGQAMVPIDDRGDPAVVAVAAGFDQGTLLGKRYADDATGIELLCTKPGPASLSLGAEPLLLKDSKPLPSSD